jgi:hypothetical protein
MAETRNALRAVLVLTSGVLVVLAYGFVGYVAPRFPYYVNGLQPIDLLVYPAWLLACVLGIGLGLVLRRRPGWHPRVLRLPLLVGIAILTVTGVVGTVTALPAGTHANGSALDRARGLGLPRDSSDHQHRLGVVTDSTSSFVNGMTDLPQTRGYQDHGNLEQDYQVWWETALKGDPGQSEQVRHFLLDWNAVGTVMTDPVAGAPGVGAHRLLAGRGPGDGLAVPDVQGERHRKGDHRVGGSHSAGGRRPAALRPGPARSCPGRRR